MGKKRLLIIEDDIDVSEMLVTFFDNQGYEVYHADTGTEGIELARSRFPNLILLDVMLPDMVGFDVCRGLRTTNLTKYIPIIFLTQRDARADKVAGLEIGADDYITKPFDIEELRLRVQGSIRRATRDHIHEPRTGLPTGPLIRSEYDRVLDQKGWSLIEVQIAGFNEFRDRYGFLTADEAISLAAHTIIGVMHTWGTNDDFVGTTGDNGFVIFTHSADVEALRNELTANFKERSRSLYNFIDAEQGYLVIDEGTPNERQVPLMYLDYGTYTPRDAE